jgi:hypothetical protein
MTSTCRPTPQAQRNDEPPNLATPASLPDVSGPAREAAWEATLQDVRRDSRDQPARYLDEVRVPCGGE